MVCKPLETIQLSLEIYNTEQTQQKSVWNLWKNMGFYDKSMKNHEKPWKPSKKVYWNQYKSVWNGLQTVGNYKT